jgi:hypothetical protein
MADADQVETAQLHARLIEAFPAAGDAPEALRRRVEAAAASAAAARPTMRWRRRLAVAGALGAIAWSTVTIQDAWSAAVAARTLRDMARAVRAVQTARIVVWQTSPDQAYKTRTVMQFKEGRWRVEDREGRVVQIVADGQRRTWDAGRGVVLVDPLRGGPAIGPPGSGLAGISADLLRWARYSRARAGREIRSSGGRALRPVQITLRGLPQRSAMLIVDAATSLPLSASTAVIRGGRMQADLSATFEFGLPLDDRLFKPDFPAAARVVDRDADRAAWQDRLARGIAGHAARPGGLRVRDVRVNRAGDVFVLYTLGPAGSGAPPAPIVSVSDTQGTVYLRPEEVAGGEALVPAHARTAGDLTALTCQGEPDYWTYWVPLVPEATRWHPRWVAAGPRVDSGDTAAAAEAVPAERTEPGIVPAYAPHMGLNVDELSLRYQAIVARLRYYRSHHDVAAAVEQARALTALQDKAELGGGVLFRRYDTWLDLYRMLTELGKRDEALTALRLARDAVGSSPAPTMRFLDSAAREVLAAARREGIEK